MALFFGSRKVTLLVGENNQRVDIDLDLNAKSTNPIANKTVVEALRNIQSDISLVCDSVETDEGILTEHEQTLLTLTADTALLKSKAENVSQNIETINSALVAFQNIADTLTSSISTINQSLTEINQKIDNLTTRVETLEGYHDNHEGVLDDLEDMFN